mmetsp:Transcript_14705/g.47967  ORF Transcript_14705/g.47967 Transcript_14705/m.47967 type:complete len:254 (-) Transcript_14705:1101-1862(-)
MLLAIVVSDLEAGVELGGVREGLEAAEGVVERELDEDALVLLQHRDRGAVGAVEEPPLRRSQDRVALAVGLFGAPEEVDELVNDDLGLGEVPDELPRQDDAVADPDALGVRLVREAAEGVVVFGLGLRAVRLVGSEGRLVDAEVAEQFGGDLGRLVARGEAASALALEVRFVGGLRCDRRQLRGFVDSLEVQQLPVPKHGVVEGARQHVVLGLDAGHAHVRPLRPVRRAPFALLGRQEEVPVPRGRRFLALPV